MIEKYKKQSIDRLNISCNSNSIEILKNNEIDKIGKLCKKTKSQLKEIKLEDKKILKKYI